MFEFLFFAQNNRVKMREGWERGELGLFLKINSKAQL